MPLPHTAFAARALRALALPLTLPLTLALCAGVHAQDYPNHPVRLITPNAAGSSIDLLARLIGQKVGDNLGQQFIVDARPGANGIIAMDATAKARPDGYTLAMSVPASMTVNQFIYKSMPYKPLTDLTPITQATKFSFALVVNPKLPVKSVADLVALNKKTAGGLNYSSSGVGNLTHLAVELLGSQAGTKFNHVPNKGESPALIDVMGGQTAFMITTLPSVVPHIKSGQLKLLAVCGTAREPAFPDTPTMTEAGFPAVQVVGWSGMVGPAGLSSEITRKLQREVAKVLTTPEARESLSKQGAEPVASTPEQFAAFLKSEADKWSKVVQSAGLAMSE
ncbi:MAG TPA: tripartite tricarboxylate transporter substrate binding protein [Burkholderiales bacterium]|jgi:tripartite-type tricarboxylate transporter receptor subunit TctC|nr:tripartite tricarboxylate transporter substrate binding protein [Burkholderiales bacterium]